MPLGQRSGRSRENRAHTLVFHSGYQVPSVDNFQIRGFTTDLRGIMTLEGLIFIQSLVAFGFTVYCWTKARQHISREKLASLEDTSHSARGLMLAKEVLDEVGLKYYRSFRIGAALFIVSLLVLFVLRRV